MNETNQKALEQLKNSFVTYLDTNKKRESNEFKKYSTMSIGDLIDELEKDIYKFKMNPSMYIGYICDNLGMNYEKHNERLNEYFILFSDIIDIIYNNES